MASGFRKRVSGLSTPGSRVTPVRRSTRRSVASLPRGLQDHDPVVAALDEIPAEKKHDMLYTPNTALHRQVMDSDEEDTEEGDANPTKSLQDEFDLAAAEEEEGAEEEEEKAKGN